MIKIVLLLWVLQPSGDWEAHVAATAPSMAHCRVLAAKLMDDPSWPENRVVTCQEVTEV